METFIAFILVVLSGCLLVYMFAQGMRRTVDFVSIRNFFLLGLIVFQYTSAAYTLKTGRFLDAYVANLPGTGQTYLISLVLFTVVYLFAYSKGWFVRRLAGATPVGSAVPGPSSALVLALAFLGVGIVFRLGLVHIPHLGILTAIVGASILAVAAGMAVWTYVPRLFNPVVGGVTVIVILAAIGVSIHKTFGRRDLMGVVLCCLWAAYHGYWKHMTPSKAVLRLAALGALGMVVIAAFSAVRSGGDRDRSAQDMARLMTGASVIEGTKDVLSGQLAGQNSMWTVENYPERYAYEPFDSLLIFLTMPVPRQYWPGKPEGFGATMVQQTGAYENKADTFTLGPGLIGHIWHDNPWLTLVPYAVLLGLFCRYLDELVRVHARNPFVVLPVGVALGQIVGLARGELGLFMFQAVSGMVVAYFSMFFIARAMALFGWRMQGEEHDAEWEDHGEEHEDAFEETADEPAEGDPHVASSDSGHPPPDSRA